MIRGIFLDIRALAQGPTRAELLSTILQNEDIPATPADISSILAHPPQEFAAIQARMRTEDQENEYYQYLLWVLIRSLGVDQGRETGALFVRMLETLTDYHQFFSLYPETLPVLSQLRERRILMAVVANWNPSLVRLVENLNLAPYFQSVVSSAALGASKPDPFIFGRALKDTGLTPQEVLHVGPSLQEDVLGAQATGIRPVWLNRSGEPGHSGVTTITDLTGILPLVEEA